MPANSETLFREKSRSFSLAARLLTAATRAAVTELYAFCREVDDLADQSREGEAGRLNRILESLKTGPTSDDDPVAARFHRLAETHGLPGGPAIELLEATVADCGPRRIETEAELLQFAYGVAGTVGLLMCPLLGARDERAAAFAIDLGIALQLTNIARDVAEDAGRDRFYLPAQWVEPEAISAAVTDRSGAATQAVDAAVDRLLARADDFYASAIAGHYFLPPRNRRAIYFALTVYRAIGDKLRRRGSGAWRQRTRLSLSEKILLGGRAYPGYRRLCTHCWKGAPPLHDADLHRLIGPAAA